MNWSELRKVFRTGCREVPALVPVRRMRQIVSSMLVMLLLTANTQVQLQTQAQVQPRGGIGDWNIVKSLMPGTRISVKTQHRYRCSVENGTDDELYGEVHVPRSFRVIRLLIRRSEIRELRIAPHPNQAKDAWIGAGIGAGAGAIAAGTMAAEANGRNYPGFPAFVGGLGGAAGGALVGGTVPIFQVLFERGKIIYKH